MPGPRLQQYIQRLQGSEPAEAVRTVAKVLPANPAYRTRSLYDAANADLPQERMYKGTMRQGAAMVRGAVPRATPTPESMAEQQAARQANRDRYARQIERRGYSDEPGGAPEGYAHAQQQHEVMGQEAKASELDAKRAQGEVSERDYQEMRQFLRGSAEGPMVERRAKWVKGE